MATMAEAGITTVHTMSGSMLGATGLSMVGDLQQLASWWSAPGGEELAWGLAHQLAICGGRAPRHTVRNE
jgi:hypothetical protein